MEPIARIVVVISIAAMGVYTLATVLVTHYL